MIKKIYISMGDPRGIGSEIIYKSLSSITDMDFTPIIIGDIKILKKYAEKYHIKIEEIIDGYISPGKIYVVGINTEGHPGRDALNYIKKAVMLCEKEEKSALVTAPVEKKIINEIDQEFIGHTECLQKLSGVHGLVMSFILDKLKLSLITTHIPLKEVAAIVTSEKIIKHVFIVKKYMEQWFKKDHVKFVICSLNPHAGEGGLLGKEEGKIFEPAIDILKEQGIDICGPFSGEHALRSTLLGEFDFIISVYHDQLLPAIKNLAGPSSNLTMGLPFVRTSPDHGPSIDIAGEDRADFRSMRYSIELASHLINNG